MGLLPQHAQSTCCTPTNRFLTTLCACLFQLLQQIQENQKLKGAVTVALADKGKEEEVGVAEEAHHVGGARRTSARRIRSSSSGSKSGKDPNSKNKKNRRQQSNF